MDKATIILTLSVFLFSGGLIIAIIKKNAIFVLIGVELMLNAANLNFAYFSSIYGIEGQVMAVFVVVLAASEAAIAIAILLQVYKYFRTIDLDKIKELKY